ncbi:MAG: Lysine-specific demethylase 2A [Marteilia pararefringens]
MGRRSSDLSNLSARHKHDDAHSANFVPTTATAAAAASGRRSMRIEFDWRSKIDWERYKSDEICILNDATDFSYSTEIHHATLQNLAARDKNNRGSTSCGDETTTKAENAPHAAAASSSGTLIDRPLVFRHTDGLQMRVPSRFTPAGPLLELISRKIGPKSRVKVFDCATQLGSTSELRHFVAYFCDASRQMPLQLCANDEDSDSDVDDVDAHPAVNLQPDAASKLHKQSHSSLPAPHSVNASRNIYNLISLEISGTRIQSEIEPPRFVRDLDWSELAWPASKRHVQFDANGNVLQFDYPKTQRYILASVAGCYTDFHIDMNGSSVWYYLHTGSKVFWAAPPTKENMRQYTAWCKSKDQNRVFLGDVLESPRCQMFILNENETLFIPSGWIHAVYTPKDSLAFGGNFLHSYAVDQHFKVQEVEKLVHIDKNFQMSQRVKLQWHVILMYTYVLGAMNVKQDAKFLENNVASIVDMEKTSANLTNMLKSLPKSYMTKFERDNVYKLLENIEKHIQSEANAIPENITDPTGVIKLCRKMLANLKEQDFKDHPADVKPFLAELKHRLDAESLVETRRKTSPLGALTSLNASANNSSQGLRHSLIRRVRCKECIACTSDDCLKCIYCLDMRKHGGPGKLKQSCLSRRCQFPKLPRHAVCMSCQNDPRFQAIHARALRLLPNDFDQVFLNQDAQTLYECVQCYQICHPLCQLQQASANSNDSVLNIDRFDIDREMPNSWLCLTCSVSKSGQPRFSGKSSDINHTTMHFSKTNEMSDSFVHPSSDSESNRTTTADSNLDSQNSRKRPKSVEYEVNSEYTLVKIENHDDADQSGDGRQSQPAQLEKKSFIEAIDIINDSLEPVSSPIYNATKSPKTYNEVPRVDSNATNLNQANFSSFIGASE